MELELGQRGLTEMGASQALRLLSGALGGQYCGLGTPWTGDTPSEIQTPLGIQAID